MSDTHGVARDQLRAFVDRIERLEEEKKTIADDIKDIFGEATGMGFSTKILKKVIALRKKDEQERMEEDAILDTYLAALGMLPQFEMFDPEEVKPASREERRRQIMSEDMDDHKTLVDEMADAGLISEEARAENKRLADAVATKFGNGPAMALQSPSKSAEAVSERTVKNADGALPVVASGDVHRDSGPGMPRTEGSAVTDRRDDHLHSPSDDDAIAAVNGMAGLANVNGVEQSSSGLIDPNEDRDEGQSLDAESADANTGGDHEVGEQKTAAQAGVLVQSAPAANGITYEAVPAVPMKSLAYASCFPLLSGNAYAALLDDIRQNGVLDPIVRMGDVIVNGWSRYNAARSLRIEYPVIPYSGKDVLIDVIGWQRSDRDWTPEQERKIAAALAKEIPDRADDIMDAFHVINEEEPA
jgi:uncharacterized protein (UPF0335 family)